MVIVNCTLCGNTAEVRITLFLQKTYHTGTVAMGGVPDSMAL